MRFQLAENAAEDFRTRDYRKLSFDEIFSELGNIGFSLDADTFEEFADSADSPEELAASFAENFPEHGERIYLLTFELWRRLLDDRETISIFCDELDHSIIEYDQDPEGLEEVIHNLLLELIDILDSNVDLGEKPKHLFNMLTEFSCFDLESFIYGFISDEIERGHDMIASELLDNYFPYIKEVPWFELLRFRLMGDARSEELRMILARYAETLAMKPNLNLDLNFLTYLTSIGHHELFFNTFKRVLDNVKDETSYLSLINILSDYYNLNDREAEQARLTSFLELREQSNTKRITNEDRLRLLNQFEGCL